MQAVRCQDYILNSNYINGPIFSLLCILCGVEINSIDLFILQWLLFLFFFLVFFSFSHYCVVFWIPNSSWYLKSSKWLLANTATKSKSIVSVCQLFSALICILCLFADIKLSSRPAPFSQTLTSFHKETRQRLVSGSVPPWLFCTYHLTLQLIFHHYREARI